jgi:hypothetical protein
LSTWRASRKGCSLLNRRDRPPVPPLIPTRQASQTASKGDVIFIEKNVNGTVLETVDQLIITDVGEGASVALGGINTILLVGVFEKDLDPHTDFAIVSPADIEPFLTS